MKLNFSLRARHRTIGAEDIVSAWMPDVRWELYQSVLNAALATNASLTPSSFLAGDHLQRIRSLVRENDPSFVLGLALYLRMQLHRKELAFMLMAELAATNGGGELAALHIGKVLQTPAELPEWLDWYAIAAEKNPRKNNGRAVRPRRALQRSLTELLRLLDEYQFTRYDRGLQLKMRSTLLLLRPKAKDGAQRDLFNNILKDKLGTRPNWQMELTALREQRYDSLELKQATLRDKWKEGISSFRIGYAALLYNLRPILAAGVSGKILKLAGEYIGNAAAIGRNRQLPFRLLEAYRELKTLPRGGTTFLLEALEQAAFHSAGNIAGFTEETRVLIAMDVSNSMKTPAGEDGVLERYDIGPLLALALKKKCRSVITGIFGNGWKQVQLPGKNILAGVEEFRFREGEAGYATNAHLVIEDLLKSGQVVDKLMIFTDCCLWDRRQFHQSPGADIGRLWRQYRQRTPGARLYLLDLSGYGTTPLQVLQEEVFLVSGWNEGIFDILAAAEQAVDALRLPGQAT